MRLIRSWLSRLVLLSMLLVFPMLAAAIDVYEFESPEKQQRFESLSAELRCPKCQNQNIGASNAPIAEDMRDQVYQRIQAGESDQQIIGAMVERFGEFVHYRPPLTRATFLLWFGPALLAIVGIVVIFLIIRRNRRESGPVLSEAERGRVDALLRSQSPPAD